MTKKIGIITLPLNFNYGGILQAFALSKTLNDMGNECTLIQEKSTSLKGKIKNLIDSQNKVHKFIRTNIPYTKVDSLKSIENHHFDALIVGSDQVWRRLFTDINKYFLGFISDVNLKKLSYAASFGVDNWEYNEQETKNIKALIQDFKAVSVRETSAVELCKQYLNKEAVFVLDPTMLLDVSIYTNLANKAETKVNGIFSYLLNDEDINNINYINWIKQKTNLEEFKIRLTKNKILKRFIGQYSINEWLNNIMNAKYIVTDSFHGCVFCILFHKEFSVLTHNNGGNARIDSLLATFHLQNRLVDKTQPGSWKELSPINWEEVDKILYAFRELSKSFLKSNLYV